MAQPATDRPQGVYAAALTPLGPDLEPDVAAFVAHSRWLLANGCDGLAPLGTTGEANSLSVDQRLKLIEASAAAGLPGERTIFGTGSCALADAVRLSRAALAAGSAGVLLLPPFYYKNVDEDGLFAFFSEVAQRVGDARLRMYLYHFPQQAVIPITLALVERLKKAYPGETIAGLKDSSGNWENTRSFIEAFPGFGVFSGSEQFLLPNLRAGSVGCISATTNVTGPLAQKVYQAWRGAEADQLQAELTETRLTLQAYPPIAGLKTIMARISGDTAWLNILPPNKRLSAAQEAELLGKLEKQAQFAPVLSQRALAA
ncbi:MAG: dihydrodipicolinate synthase family protein [Alphaproteobacteria bacterium]|nr:dihydrodipicolinate synthase family protein [Alphaproteobacteria bacterium]